MIAHKSGRNGGGVRGLQGCGGVGGRHSGGRSGWTGRGGDCWRRAVVAELGTVLLQDLRGCPAGTALKHSGATRFP
jgi:hypothetical protein